MIYTAAVPPARGTPDDWDRVPDRLPYGHQRGTCELPGCQPHRARGLCRMHDKRRRDAAKRGTPEDWDRSPGPLRVTSGRAVA